MTCRGDAGQYRGHLTSLNMLVRVESATLQQVMNAASCARVVQAPVTVILRPGTSRRHVSTYGDPLVRRPLCYD